MLKSTSQNLAKGKGREKKICRVRKEKRIKLSAF